MPVFGPGDGGAGPEVQNSLLNGLAINQQVVITIENHLRVHFSGVQTDEIADVGVTETWRH